MAERRKRRSQQTTPAHTRTSLRGLPANQDCRPTTVTSRREWEQVTAVCLTKGARARAQGTNSSAGRGLSSFCIRITRYHCLPSKSLLTGHVKNLFLREHILAQLGYGPWLLMQKVMLRMPAHVLPGCTMLVAAPGHSSGGALLRVGSANESSTQS
jgi:hypothetical protein